MTSLCSCLHIHAKLVDALCSLNSYIGTVSFYMTISILLLPLSSNLLAQGAEEEVEKVTVTGSFIRRGEGFIQASQTTRLNADDLEVQGTLNLGEIVQNLTFVNGAASAIDNTIQGTSSTSNSIDLRGLGARSTLTLVDGKRVVNQNLQLLIPTIAIEHMDIVANGAALYGSEAVAGVVNFVPYKSYDGLKIDIYAEETGDGDYDEQSAQVLWGTQVGEIEIVLAGQYHQNSHLSWDERNLATSDYFLDYGNIRSYREPTEKKQYYANASWEANENLALSFQGFRSRQAILRYSSTSNQGNSRIGEIPVVRGEIPGNPFWAADVNGNQLYGVDENGDGIPDRGTNDFNGDGLNDYIVSGTVANGLPLPDDFIFRTLRPINRTILPDGTLSSVFNSPRQERDILSRFTLQADFTVPFLKGWEGMAAWSTNERDNLSVPNRNFDITGIIRGLNCDVVNDRDACYNPFFVTDPANAIPSQVTEAIAAQSQRQVVDSLDMIDIVLNGEIPLSGFELPGGPISAAIGYQYRDESITNTPTQIGLTGDTWIGGTEQDLVTGGSREVDAYFAEFSFPVLSTLEVSAALRHEEFSIGQDSTDPKYGLTWQATDWLTLRATRGDTFVAPALRQLFSPVTCGLSVIDDRFSDFGAFTTGCSGGDRTLENEVSDSTQFGFNLTFDNFDLALTWSETNFGNRIINTSAQDIIEFDFLAFQHATGFTGDGESSATKPALDQLVAWINDPRSNKDIIRDPGDPATILQVNGLGAGNAEEVTATAYDLQASYTFSMSDWGGFHIGLQATYVDEFLYQSKPTDPIVDGVGNYNDDTDAAPVLPKIKANLQLGWTRGNHSITAIARYVDGIDNYGGPLFSYLDIVNSFRQGETEGTDIKAWSQLDANYTYSGVELFNGELSLTIGGRNLSDREPQYSPGFPGIVGGLGDALNRVFYARAVYDF